MDAPLETQCEGGFWGDYSRSLFDCFLYLQPLTIGSRGILLLIRLWKHQKPLKRLKFPADLANCARETVMVCTYHAHMQ